MRVGSGTPRTRQRPWLGDGKHMAGTSRLAKRQPVAVFDYDGTCIRGQSGLLVARWLLRRGHITPLTAWRLSLWGARYFLHLPNSQERARELIINDLKHMSANEIDELLVEFHREVLVPRYRSRALEEIRRRRDEGCCTVLISATFDPIAREAARHLGADGYVATRMQRTSDGDYTGRVDGEVVEGAGKVLALRSWADSDVGKDGWYIAYAYGDHHSDADILSSAEHPVAVNPSPALWIEARRQQWDMQNWNRRS